MFGRIIQGIGSFYTIECDRKTYVCKARGHFRRERISPLVGDLVQFSPAANEDSEGVMEDILPRVSELVRPAIANIDLLLIILAVESPEPDLLLVDRLLIRARKMNIDPVIVVNKTDLSEEKALRIREQYEKSGIQVFSICARSGEKIYELSEYLKGHVTALAGQSAVGKSTLMNSLCGLSQETGEVSRIERGRHTTRRVQLFRTEEGGYLADTPGFSLLELEVEDPSVLKSYYPEFTPYEEECRFRGCNHLEEPDCAVKRAANEGKLSQERLERYAQIYQEIKLKWGRRYD